MYDILLIKVAWSSKIQQQLFHHIQTFSSNSHVVPQYIFVMTHAIVLNEWSWLLAAEARVILIVGSLDTSHTSCATQ